MEFGDIALCWFAPPERTPRSRHREGHRWYKDAWLFASLIGQLVAVVKQWEIWQGTRKNEKRRGGSLRRHQDGGCATASIAAFSFLPNVRLATAPPGPAVPSRCRLRFIYLRISHWHIQKIAFFSDFRPDPAIAAINRGRSILCSRYLFPRVVSYYNCFKWLVVLSDLGSLSRTWTKARYIESKDMVQSGCWPHPPYIRPCTSSSPQLII